MVIIVITFIITIVNLSHMKAANCKHGIHPALITSVTDPVAFSAPIKKPIIPKTFNPQLTR
jgi:hypothetical protein